MPENMRAGIDETCELCGADDELLELTSDGSVLACPACRARYENESPVADPSAWRRVAIAGRRYA